MALIAAFFHANVEADNFKIHAIVFCNTNDKNIGESCQSDQERFVQELGLIETAIGCEEEWKVFVGDDCNKPNLERTINELNCGPNDVVFFYYSGHGVHAGADPADGWLPQMCLNYESYDQDKFVPVTYVRDRLAAKGARLSLILTDCCNKDANWVSVKGFLSLQGEAPSTKGINVSKLKKLFHESRGTVMATSSKRGQVSYGPKQGGCFSVAFWEEMAKVEQGLGEASWKSLLEATKKRTLQSTSQRQEPAYKVEVGETTGSSPASSGSQANTSPVVVAGGERELREAFKRIVSPSFSHSERWNMVGGIVERLFAPGAQVLIVGRNLTTFVGRPASIGKYLEELALSKKVKGINIVRATKDGTGKFNNIVISEIR